MNQLKLFNRYYILLSIASLLLLLIATVQIYLGTTLFKLQQSTSTIPKALNINITSTKLNINHLTLKNTINLEIQSNLNLNLKQLTHQPNRLESTILRSIINRSPSLTIQTSNSPIQISQQHPFLELTLKNPLILPISYSDQKTTTTTTTIQLQIRFPDPSLLPQLLLNTQPLKLTVNIAHLDLHLNQHPGQPSSWLFRKLTHLSLSNVILQLPVTLPKIPEEWADPSKLLKLSSYAFYPLPDQRVGIRATVSAPNPLKELRRRIDELSLDIDVPWPIPLSALLVQGQQTHQLVPLASTHTLPFSIDPNSDSLALSIEGYLLPSLASNHSSNDLPEQDPLSTFLNKFLAGKSNPLAIRYDPPITHEEIFEPDKRGHQVALTMPTTIPPPTLISAFLSALDLRLLFPGSTELELIESIEVEDMHIHLPSLVPPHSKLLCSGILHAVVALPSQLSGLSHLLAIPLFKPDVFLLNGPLPSVPYNSTDPPANAFATLKPPAFIPSSLVISPSNSTRLILSAILDKIPLHIPPGRSSVFRAYAAKYILHHRTNSSKQNEGVVTSMIGTFDAHAILASHFPIQMQDVNVHGTFFV